MSAPRPAPVRVRHDLRLRTRDGITLSADLYYPPEAGPHPVLLMRQPYGKPIASTVVYAQPEYFARAGFLVVIQDVRGRGESGGTFYPFRHEAEDGRATIEWAAGLEGSDGRVCMYGFSYQAYTQLAVLDPPPPALAAIAPHMSAADLYEGWFYRSGIARLATTLSWGTQMSREDAWRAGAETTARALESAWTAPGNLARQLPHAETDPLARPDAPPYPADWLSHPERDDYWRELDHGEALARARVPVFHLAGYYDFYLRGSELAYACREDKSRDFFLLGPWKHIPWERWMGGVDLGEAARPDTDRILVDWFNAQLGRGNGDAHSGVRYFVLGENDWRSADHWPPPADPAIWHLVSAGNANSCFGDGRLAPETPDAAPPDHFVYDPEVPVTAPGGMNPAWAPVDLREQQQGNNMLVYDTAPFHSAATFAGNAELHLHVASTAPCTDFVARLSWLRPDGTARFLCLAAGPVELENAAEADEDGAVPVRLRFDATAVTLPAGHAVRLDIASSAFPRLARHPNTRRDRLRVAAPTGFRKARQTVFHDAARPSRLVLPWIA